MCCFEEERVTHQTRRGLRNGKLNKDTTQKSLDSCFNHMTVGQRSSYFGDFFFPLSLTQDFTCTENPTLPQDCRQGCSHLMPQCTSGLQQGSQLTCPLLNTHGHLVMRKQTRRSLRDEEGGRKWTNQHKKRRHAKMPAEGYDIHMHHRNKSSHVKTGGFLPQYLLF